MALYRHPMRLYPLDLYRGAASTVNRWYTRAVNVLRAAVLRTPPPRLGISVGRVASLPAAESELASMATSPTAYAAVNRRATFLSSFPILVLNGWSIGGGQPDPVDPERVIWAASLLRLLQLPNPADLSGVFPSDPGESLLAQLIADLILTGNAFVAISTGPQEQITGLYRCHPGAMALERRTDGDYWVYRPGGGSTPISYPRRTVAHIRLPSWQRSGAGELGTGAGASLAALLRAENTALNQTATVIEQGGADIILKSTDAAGAAFLKVDKNRQQIVDLLCSDLKGPGGRRVMAVGGAFELDSSGLTPADLRAPDLMAAAKDATLAATGCTPVFAGEQSANYATAALQFRVQAALDESLVGALEASLLRPLARHFCRKAGGRWAGKAETVTARIDLSSHPGYIATRDAAIARMERLKNMGWSPEQAAEAEGVLLPHPEGTPGPAPAAAPSSPDAPTVQGEGGGTGDDPTPAKGPPPARSVAAWMARSALSVVPPQRGTEREELFRAAEARRVRADASLLAASTATLETERDFYIGRIRLVLSAALRSGGVPATREAGRYSYSAFDMDAILGAYEDAVARWETGLSPSWSASWADAADGALRDVEGLDPHVVPIPEPSPAVLDLLETSASQVADYSRERVRAVVGKGTDDGASVNEIADRLRADQGFSHARALRIARTETIRTETSGTQERGREATRMGFDLEQEWLSDGLAAEFERHHNTLDGVTAPVDGGSWTYESGISTVGPGLSGDPGEDCNCRCAVRIRRKRRGGASEAAK